MANISLSEEELENLYLVYLDIKNENFKVKDKIGVLRSFEIIFKKHGWVI